MVNFTESLIAKKSVVKHKTLQIELFGRQSFKINFFQYLKVMVKGLTVQKHEYSSVIRSKLSPLTIEIKSQPLDASKELWNSTAVS
jgi:hypothetical protein